MRDTDGVLRGDQSDRVVARVLARMGAAGKQQAVVQGLGTVQFSQRSKFSYIYIYQILKPESAHVESTFTKPKV